MDKFDPACIATNFEYEFELLDTNTAATALARVGTVLSPEINDDNIVDKVTISRFRTETGKLLHVT